VSTTAYQVLHIENYVSVIVSGRKLDVPLTWADGMLGVSPLFATREQAETYAMGDSVVAVEVNLLDHPSYRFLENNGE